MDITSEDIESITTAVWATMLEQDLIASTETRVERIDVSHVGLVTLTGAFVGLVTVHLSEGMVRGAASQMFEVPARDVDADQMRDTVAELTNMVGGNVKCLVEQPTQLGLPEVMTERDTASRVGPTMEETSLGFASPDGGVVVVIHQLKAA